MEINQLTNSGSINNKKKRTAMRFVKGAPASLLLSLKPKHSAIGLVLSLVVRFWGYWNRAI